MRKAKSMFLAATLLMMSALCRAQTIQVTVNGSPVNFAGAGPRSVEGRVMVPLRGVLEKLGAYIEWVPSNRAVIAQKGDIDLELRIGEKMAQVNGRQIGLDVPAMIMGGSTMVPLRFMGEALGAEVVWDNAARTVVITTDKSGGQNAGQRPDLLPDRGNAGKLPGITSFAISKNKWFRSGMKLEAVLNGTPGGKASFTVPGIIERVEMQETSEGRYTGSWAVPQDSDIGITDASVIGILQLSGRERMIQAADPISIDTVPPKVTDLMPEPKSKSSNRRPSISLVFDDGSGSGIDPKTVNLWVNGKIVTSAATVTQNFVSYRPESPLPEGANRTLLEARDRAGNPANRSWTFVVEPKANAIKSFTHTPLENLGPGDVIAMKLTGTPGGRAFFTVGTVSNQTMTEQSPGVYSGEYTIRKGDVLSRQPIRARLVVSDQTYNVQSSSQAKADAGPPDKPTIVSPARDAAITSPLVVSGKAALNSKVLVKVEYHTTVLGALALGGTLSEQIIDVDNKGNYKTEPIDLDTLVSGKGTEYTITATAVNPNNQRSQPVALKFTRS